MTHVISWSASKWATIRVRIPRFEQNELLKEITHNSPTKNIVKSTFPFCVNSCEKRHATQRLSHSRKENMEGSIIRGDSLQNAYKTTLCSELMWKKNLIFEIVKGMSGQKQRTPRTGRDLGQGMLISGISGKGTGSGQMKPHQPGNEFSPKQNYSLQTLLK